MELLFPDLFFSRLYDGLKDQQFWSDLWICVDLLPRKALTMEPLRSTKCITSSDPLSLAISPLYFSLLFQQQSRGRQLELECWKVEVTWRFKELSSRSFHVLRSSCWNLNNGFIGPLVQWSIDRLPSSCWKQWNNPVDSSAGGLKDFCKKGTKGSPFPSMDQLIRHSQQTLV
jgi:hypothetical protein